MKSMIWVTPDGRYHVTLVRAPDADTQSMVFHRDDGWSGAATLPVGLDLLAIHTDELARLLEQAKAP